MKVSYKWLNSFLNSKMPEAQKVSDVLTMNSMEVETTERMPDDYVLDVKTTPNNNHSCLCHRGIANEIGVLLALPMSKYSRDFKSFSTGQTINKLSINIEDPKICRRYIGRIIENIKVGPSPKWLSDSLETLGQRSINNLVDATNFIMYEIGQPLHVFDADKLVKGRIVNIEIKNAKAGDALKTLDAKDISLDENTLLITDGKNPLAIAGVKGGTFAEIDENTKNIVLESANFEPTNIRKTSQRLKIQTDASKRFENDFSPEIAIEAMERITALIVEIAGHGKTVVGESLDVYPRRANKYKVGISTEEARAILGIDIQSKDIENIFKRFGFEYEIVKPIDKILSIAESFVGVPYKLGASVSYDAPRAFDCSGFIAFLFSQVGVQIPRISVDQYVFGELVEKNDIKAGDVIYINTKVGKIYKETVEFLPGTKVESGVDHSALYLGKGRIIHSSNESGGVVLADFSKIKGDIVGYRRMSDNTDRFVITIPDERIDLRIKEDIAEEIGRVYGYENIKDIKVPKPSKPVIYNKAFYYSGKIRNILNGLGFSEVYTYSFVSKGDFELANTIASEKRFIRNNLTAGMSEALEFNARYSELVEMSEIKIFEIGKVFTKDGEKLHLSIGVKSSQNLKNKNKDADLLTLAVNEIEKVLSVKLNKINKENNIAEFNLSSLFELLPEPTSYDFDFDLIDNDLRYKKISVYPFIIRDIAVFVGEGEKEENVFRIIKNNATNLLVKSRLFDVFTKEIDGVRKTSYAYRLVFQSNEKTLSDDEVNKIMDRITQELNSKDGYKVR